MGELRDGITEASNGAGLLAHGLRPRDRRRAADRARAWRRAAGGSQRAINALERFSKGTEKLTEGAAGSGDRGAADPASAGSTRSPTAQLQRPAVPARTAAGAARRAERNAAPPGRADHRSRRKAAGGGSEAEGSGADRPGRGGGARIGPGRRWPRSPAPTRRPALPTTKATRASPPNSKGCEERLGEDAELNKRTSSFIYSVDRTNCTGLGRGTGQPDRRPLRTAQGRQHAVPRGATSWPRKRAGSARAIDQLSNGAASLVSGPRPAERRGGSAGSEPRGGRGRSRTAGERARRSERQGAGRQGEHPQAGGRSAGTDAGALQLGVLRALGARRGAARAARKSGGDDRPEQRRPGGLDAGDLEVRIQLARLDPAEPGTGERGGRTGAEREPRDRRRGRRGAAERLQQDHPRTDPLDHRAHHPRHLPGPGRGAAGAAAGGDRGRRSTCSRSGSPSASSRCSSTSPPTGRWAATTTSTRSAPA